MTLINGAFRAQQITGQQRYATEIATRLLTRTGVRELRPPRPSKAAAWAWTQLALPVAARDEVLVSLTSRAPIVARRHVVTVHDLFPLTHPEWYSRSYLAVHRPLLRRHLRSAPVLVCVSAPVAEQVRPLARPDADIVVAPNAPSSLFTAAASAGLAQSVIARARIGNGTSAPAGYVLSVASVDPRKNLRRLAQAHAALPDDLRHAYPLVLVGAQAPQFRSGDVEDADHIIRAGYVNDAELASLYQHAQLVVLPSLDEGFGLPAVEAAAARVPLALSDIPVFRWVCGSHAEYFDPTETASMTSALRRALTTSPDERVDKLATEVTERFSWTLSAQTISDAVSRRFGP